MRKLSTFKRAAVAAIIVLAALSATTTRAEAQATPADSAGVLVGVAAQLQAEGRVELAHALLQLVRDRYPNTPAAAEAARLLGLLQQNTRDESGRTELMVFGATYGAALGIGFPIAFNSDSPEGYGIGLIVGAPLGFLLSRAYAHNRPLSEGQASAIISGTLWGAWQSFGWMRVLDIGEGEECFQGQPGDPEFCSEVGADADEIVSMMIAGSVVGLGVGAALSRKHITNGTAATVNFGALWGSWFGLALGIWADQDDDALFTSALLGGNAGLVGGALGNSRWRLSESRARLISIAGVAGGLAGLGALLIASPDDVGNEAVLVPLAGSIAGIGLGAYWTRHLDRDAMIGGRRSRLGLELPSFQPMLVDNGRKRVPVMGLTLIQARF
jgi:hypothetical protein